MNKLKRVIAVLLFCVMSVTRLFGGEAELISATEELEEYVITTDSISALKKVKNQYEENIVDDYKTYDVDDKQSLYVGLTESQRKRVEEIDGVIGVEENITFSASHSNVKKPVKRKKAQKPDALDWNLRMIGVTSKTLKQTTNNGTIKIAIMDSGVDFSKDVNVVERVNLVDNEKYIASYYEDITSHGTSIAGIISDINPDAELYSVRVLDSKNTAKLDRVIEGIYWCIDNDIDIINMSFGTAYKSVALQKAVNAAYDAGILLVSAAGNGGNEESVEYPAAFDKVIAVGSVDKNAVLTEDSATGEEMELVAPGSQILTDGAYGGSLVAGGTSLSVAHVTGVASVIWKKDVSKSNQFVRSVLAASAKKIGDSKLYGNGLVDLRYALQHYDEYTDVKLQIACETEEIEEGIYSENDTAVKTFDDVELVEGRWSSVGHEGLVDYANAYKDMEVGFTTDELLIIKDACAKVDGIFDPKTNEEKSIYYFRTATKNVLHGRYNYVATMRYLFRVCRSVYESSEGTTVASCCNLYSYSPYTDYPDYDVSIRDNLKSAIQYMAAADTPIENPSGISWQKKRGLRILGMLMHVVGDTYAHKTKVPVSSISNGTITAANIIDGASWDEFKRIVGKGMMFNQVKNYLGSGYEDNVQFYTERYESAKKVSNIILRHFAVKSEDVAIDTMLKDGLKYDGNSVLCEETQLAYLSKHVRWEYNDTSRARVAGTASFIPYTGEYINIK